MYGTCLVSVYVIYTASDPDSREMFKCKLGEGAKDRYSGALNRFSGSWLCYNCPASPKSCPPNNYSPNGPHISRCLHHHSEGIFKAPNCTFNASLILWLSDRRSLHWILNRGFIYMDTRVGSYNYKLGLRDRNLFSQ